MKSSHGEPFVSAVTQSQRQINLFPLKSKSLDDMSPDDDSNDDSSDDNDDYDFNGDDDNDNYNDNDN